MKGFVEDSIDLKVPKEGVIRTTLSELNYCSEVVNDWIKVEIGLETDLGSIPKPLQILFPKDGLAIFAYILHDFLYKTGFYERSICDDILEEAMLSLGVGFGTRKSVRYGLLIGGGFAYANHRKNDKEELSTWG